MARNVLCTIHRRKANWIGQILHGNCLLIHVIGGEIEGRSDGEEEEEDVNSYWTTLMKRVDTGN
jgi:hypothetical protein